MKQTVGVVFITYRAKKLLPHCLPPILESSLKPKVLVVNSSSNDGTVEIAKKMGAEVQVVTRSSFNHGKTRELARKQIGTDIVVMATPDAYAVSSNTLEQLVSPMQDKMISCSYARQIPHEGADFFEAFQRQFNYPDKSHIRSIDDIKKYGSYTFFCSNSFAAWKNRDLEEIGGFQEVLLGEDTLACAKLLQNGRKIAYVADAVVKHSHKASLIMDLKRYFDIGLARKLHEEIFSHAGSVSDRGYNYAKELLRSVWRNYPIQMPYACLHLISKWLGYHVGRSSPSAPLFVKRWLSSQDFYWKKSITDRDNEI